MDQINNPHHYPEAVWQRFLNPAHAGFLPSYQHQASAHSPAQGYHLQVFVNASEARFLAWGCPYTIAVGQYVCERWQAGQRSITANELVEALSLPPEKRVCAFLAEDVWRICALS